MLEAAVGRRLADFIQITRMMNCFVAALVTLLGAYLADRKIALLSPAVLGAALVVGLVVAAANVVNDYWDVDVDSQSKPGRPIPSGRISRRSAGTLAALLALAALIVAWTLGPESLAITLAAVTLSAGYSYVLKRTVLLGNGVVGLLAALALAYGGVVAGSPTLAVGMASLLIALFIFPHEILKTTADQLGDARAGIRTVATCLGRAAALRMFQLFALVFVTAATLPWLLTLAPNRYLYAMLACAILPTLAIVARIGWRASDEEIRRSLLVLKILWLIGLIPLALLK